ncbi:hypothetical protein P618_200944 [Holospora obtusa F1]|uniref:Uncharacterized protein n=1 Tax=Holospora obtusa F1 TaxID=1399147 RepID=W6TD66_HOLOB|nr:hypothetical protein [Holospora obtusa]ETZ06873.1 hypothetical protein P618_200944 [Holospora obtusa F1]
MHTDYGEVMKLNYHSSWRFQKKFLEYIQKELASFQVPVLLCHTSNALPYICLSLKTLQEFFKGKAWFFMEITLLQSHYSAELDLSITEKMYEFNAYPVVISDFDETNVKKIHTYFEQPVRSFKENKQNYSTLWTVSLMSRWMIPEYCQSF